MATRRLDLERRGRHLEEHNGDAGNAREVAQDGDASGVRLLDLEALAAVLARKLRHRLAAEAQAVGGLLAHSLVASAAGHRSRGASGTVGSGRADLSRGTYDAGDGAGPGERRGRQREHRQQSHHDPPRLAPLSHHNERTNAIFTNRVPHHINARLVSLGLLNPREARLRDFLDSIRSASLS